MRIRIERSARRHKTVSARWEDEELVIQAPSRMSDRELAPYIETLRRRIESRKGRSPTSGDADLMERAQHLNKRFFQGKLNIVSVRYVCNQNKRFGSCSSLQGTIRISHRLRRVPAWVLDYVLMHELAHLVEPNHSSRFWALVRRYPKTERAIGYLLALGLGQDDAPSDQDR